MTILAERTCRCGHVRSTHYKHVDNCLAMLCECKTFRDPRDPETVARPAHHPERCRCYECKRALGITS